MKLLDQMKADGIELDGYSYSSAISACGHGGRWKEALELIRQMKEGGPKTRPNRVAYTAAITACGRSGEWKHALELFDTMRNEGLQPDRVAYNALVFSLRVGRRPNEAYEIWSEMCGKTQGISRTTTTKKYASARADQKHILPDEITVSEIIATLHRTAIGRPNSTRIDEVFSEAVKRGIFLNPNSLNSMWEVDLSGMPLPVASAACRFVLNNILRIAQASGTSPPDKDVQFITGTGKSHAMNGGDDDEGTTTTLREHVRGILSEEFDPPLYATIPKRAQGTVVIRNAVLQKWISSKVA
eukprot:CAMPEP_0118691436 /NCGR_PEP_ID=MMETSP0800-20121206/10681_1 /TAXON_ID=210618 ORGANISM="Striatella unipunctata, Strain CCMP2910" /NCGR_SAMPLE_ID=MMETSP0800 /ASSEMBLY_ACC=CAM_ASM_000638 /LENGTH=298 /DNA_ID=CAMNT_0006589219 /DNA_START=20 /DNA_END=916 /DNA_ORIENTATION=+